jgi:type IV secretion system protein TrbJ
MKKRFLALALGLIFFAAPLWALFGIGDIVFDPTSYANAILMLAELVKNYNQLQLQYELQSWLAKAVPVDMSTRYRTTSAAWYGLQVPSDQFGNLSSWVQEVNQGGHAQTAYNNAAVTLKPYGSALAQLATEERAKVASEYASTELADGTNVQTMETVGMLRANATAVDRAISDLQSDSLSQDPAMNTEVGVLNKINAAAIASLRSSRDSNRMLLSVLEQQLVQSKRTRDSEASEINTQIDRLEHGAAAKGEFTSTLGQTLQSFRWK